jgi:hypothetical protein
MQPVTPPSPDAEGDVLKAVVIVGDFDDQTAGLKDDMDAAVGVLQDHGVSVTKFYYGDTSYDWSDVVDAAQGAHFLLSMVHGLQGWSGSNYYGGLGFGDSDSDGDDDVVSPDQIRNDLADTLAPDSIVIFSHVCFTTGSPPPDIPQADAAERVQSYAEPFTDIGMEAYFANNYYDSAAQTVSLILSGKTMEEVFKGGVAYAPEGLVDLAYPKAGYELWLDRCAYHNGWNLAFVGIPDYVFPFGAPTATPTPTATSTPTPTSTPTSTSTPTATPTSTSSPTVTPTATGTATATSTPTPTATSTSTPTGTATPADTATPTPTSTAVAEHWEVYLPVVLKE